MDVSQMPSRPRGHPSRLYSEIACMQQSKVFSDVNNIVSSSVTMQSPNGSSSIEGYQSGTDENEHQVDKGLKDHRERI